MDMNMAYDGWLYDRGYYYSFYWQILDIAFSSSASAPVVTTVPPTAVTSVSARLNGTVNPNGQSTTYHFEYGPSPGYGAISGAKSAGSGTAIIPVNAVAAGLRPDTLYHYRLVATNSAGTNYGSDQTFTTAKARSMPWLKLLLRKDEGLK
jgi:hypothetical protein